MKTPFVYQLAAPHRLEQVPDEVSFPSPGMARINTLISTVSPGTELAAFRGLPPLRPTANVYPRLVGYCNIGRVRDIGENVSFCKPNDLILTHAAHRSCYVVGAHEILAILPQDCDQVAASTTYLFHLGYSAWLKAKGQAGDRVAVVGLGTLGLTTASVARMAGAFVTGYSEHPLPQSEWSDFGLENVRAKSDLAPSEYDIVFSTTNSWADWQLALEVVRPGGMIVVIGFPGRGERMPDINPLDSRYLYDKQITIAACGHMPDLDASEMDIRHTLKRNCAFLLMAILDGRLPAKQLVLKVVPANQLEMAYIELTANRVSGKTMTLHWGAVGTW